MLNSKFLKSNSRSFGRNDVSFILNLSVKFYEFPKCAEYDLGFWAGSARCAGKMMHTHLCYSKTAFVCAGQDLAIDQASVALHFDVVENLPL